jgi:hypothetical protein
VHGGSQSRISDGVRGAVVVPPLKYKRKPCSQCGARTEKQAETVCKQQQDVTGEYSCAGEFDRFGWSIQPTPESIKTMDDWCVAEMRKSGL